MDKVFKAFSVISKAIDLEAGIFEAMISTEAVDRSGDIVRATGAKLDNYLKNPVVMWAHEYGEPPIARALSIEIMPGKGLKATFQFPAWGTSARADEVRRLWAAGFLNATSIGFIPLTANPIDQNDKYGWGPQDYVEWELLEFSIVPVPANQEALRLAVKSLEVELNKPRGQVDKQGRVLSAANEGKVRKAQELLADVLAQLQEEDPVQEGIDIELPGATPVSDTGKAEPTADDDTEQRSDAIADQLTNLISALKEKYQNG